MNNELWTVIYHDDSSGWKSSDNRWFWYIILCCLLYSLSPSSSPSIHPSLQISSLLVESSVSISLSLSSGLTLSDDDLNECLRVRVIPGSTRLCPDPPNLSLVSGERCSFTSRMLVAHNCSCSSSFLDQRMSQWNTRLWIVFELLLQRLGLEKGTHVDIEGVRVTIILSFTQSDYNKVTTVWRFGGLWGTKCTERGGCCAWLCSHCSNGTAGSWGQARWPRRERSLLPSLHSSNQ